jgi:putative effector of murein hydrolase LrgA (UPF0299 family)
MSVTVIRNNPKLTLSQILADPKNKDVSSKFFNFAFFMIPIGVLILVIQLDILSVQNAGILAVILVNMIMGVYALTAYREEVSEWKEDRSEGKQN